MNNRNTNIINPPSNRQDQAVVVLRANVVLTLCGIICFGVSLLSGAMLVLLYIFPNENQQTPLYANVLFARVISPSLLFLVGWVCSFASIKFLKNRLLPKILEWAGYFVSVGMTVIYAWGAIKCFRELDLSSWKYAVVLAAGYIVLVAFFLLSEEPFDIRRMAIIPVLALVIHIFALVFHYVFLTIGNSVFIWRDLELIVIVVILIGFILDPRPYIPLRQAVNAMADNISRTLPPILRLR